ncbi:LysR family transcriptional regulator [Rhizobium leguminosarum]|jgi:DNA-binding transcriptional LysR family regulator|uniref:LysR family transcriptional regulator n=1 Tax=Rhizobium leguminosarum TaxID=384 RepID=A0A7M3DNP6_RHILE|nr:LysR family transcriptional regulator [Rhizobium leguminosarum]MBP2485606.1 DNA-binding transcriptional LysR family regulator [Rhizobium leguminosarum]MBY5899775.1 LysR family transcriptional regulator [Rhizobium leguminosarum]MBY5905977.1 LysR family transcriptional regulator [Rhizobium leguminosarum]MDI5924414.1 LysR family transcriptional regulator [Rhizobium leguminosarum]MDV4161329.1 LysR family transcriptional regulator [Rhizobium leguminosarum]
MKTFGDFDGLALFIRIVQAGGFGAAERATGISKATLSRRLSALEDALNVRLVRRTKKGVVLTDNGQQLYDRSRDAFLLAEEAVAGVQDEKVALSGTVRLSLPPDMATEVLAPALIRFKTRFPDVVIEMTLADRRVSLIEEGYDLVVRMGSVADSGLAFKKIATVPRTLVASPGYLAAHSEIKEPDQLKDVPALAIRRDLVEWDLRRRDGLTVTVTPRIGFAANRQTILVEAAIAGLGVVNLPNFMIESALKSGALVRVLPDWEPSPVEMTALWQKDRITGRLIKAIVAEFVEALRDGQSLK